MASIYERKTGKYQWQAQIRRKGYPRQVKTFETKAEAEAWARLIESEMDRGIFVSRQESENTTLSEALDRYEKEVSSEKKSHKIEKFYIQRWKEALGGRYLATIKSKDIAEYRDKRIKEVSATSVRHELSLLSHLFSITIKEWGMVNLTNPVQQIRRPKANPARERRVSVDEIKKIHDAATTSLRPIIFFALETAMRRSEIAGMTWDMVDIKKKTVTLPETKNGEKRIVPLSSVAIRILQSRKKTQRIDRKVWDLQGPSITAAFMQACKDAKVDDVNFHDLRHEATSRFFEKGLNPMQVAAITGHKTLQMLKRYTHLKAEDLAELLK